MFSKFNKKSAVHPITTEAEYKDTIPVDLKEIVADYYGEITRAEFEDDYKNYSEFCDGCTNVCCSIASGESSLQNDFSKVTRIHGLNFFCAATAAPTKLLYQSWLWCHRTSDSVSCPEAIACALIDVPCTAISAPVGVVGCVGISAVDATMFAVAKIDTCLKNKAQERQIAELSNEYGLR
jgi:hypothetical protein